MSPEYALVSLLTPSETYVILTSTVHGGRQNEESKGLVVWAMWEGVLPQGQVAGILLEEVSASSLGQEGAREGKMIQCQYCLIWAHNKLMTKDHFIPKSECPKTLIKKNLVNCCWYCNILKGNKIFKSIDAVRTYIKERSTQMNGLRPELK